MPDTRTIGFGKEDEACRYLKKLGYKILERNFITVFGEIDIIAKQKKVLVFVEVKYRKNLSGGLPQESVTPAKQKKIIKSAIIYIKQKAFRGDYRFDIAAITDDKIEIIESAFSSNEYFI